MKYRFAVLTVSLAVLIGGMLWGLQKLRRDVDTAFEKYQEARLIERAQFRVAYAHILLKSEPLRPNSAYKELNTAIELLEEFMALQHTQTSRDRKEAVALHESAESTLAKAAYDTLRLAASTSVEDVADGDDGLPSAQLGGALKRALNILERAKGVIDSAMIQTRRIAAVRMRSTIVIAAVFSVTIGAIGAVMNLWQYRSVIWPIRRLRDSARQLAAGRFDEHIAVGGDDEFTEVEEEFNRMARELDSLYRELEEKVRIKSKELIQSERLASVGFLAAGVAHEINNPLNIISGHAELSLRRSPTSAGATGSYTSRDRKEVVCVENLRSLEIIRDEAFRCKKITAKLLSLARAGTDDRSRVSIPHLIGEVVSMVQGLKQYRGRHLTTEVADAVELSVLVNEVELKQVLLNLTVNALEAVEPDGGRVVITGGRCDGWVEVAVRDNGRGMAPETLDRVFEPFFTTRRGSAERGVGLGLAITHAIVESHGGRLSAQSEGLGKGSRFTILLPARKNEVE